MDEFMNMADEKQIPYLDAFLDGFAKKMARTLDISAMHGVNPAVKPLNADDSSQAKIGSCRTQKSAFK